MPVKLERNSILLPFPGGRDRVRIHPRHIQMIFVSEVRP